jgi:hypothetical protein
MRSHHRGSTNTNTHHHTPRSTHLLDLQMSMHTATFFLLKRSCWARTQALQSRNGSESHLTLETGRTTERPEREREDVCVCVCLRVREFHRDAAPECMLQHEKNTPTHQHTRVCRGRCTPTCSDCSAIFTSNPCLMYLRFKSKQELQQDPATRTQKVDKKEKHTGDEQTFSHHRCHITVVTSPLSLQHEVT